MIPELIISGEEANGEFLMLVPGKMLFCSFCVMLMKQVRKIVSVGIRANMREHPRKFIDDG